MKNGKRRHLDRKTILKPFREIPTARVKTHKLLKTIGSPLISALIAAVLSSAITSYYQSEVTDRQLRHADSIRLEELQRRKLATSIILSNQMSEIHGQLVGLSQVEEPIYVSAVAGWTVSSTALMEWDVGDLALYDKRMLGHFGSLIAILSQIDSTVVTIKTLHSNPNPGETLTADEYRKLRVQLAAAIISSGYIMEKSLDVYREHTDAPVTQ